MTALLEVREVTKRFGGLTAVRNVTFSLQRGELTGILGPNGAGKTTLFNVLTGFMPPTSGTRPLQRTNRSTGSLRIELSIAASHAHFSWPDRSLA